MKSLTPYLFNGQRKVFTLPGYLSFIIAMSALALLTGCQEDDRATHATTFRASELANNRLNTAAGGLLDTLGQQKPADKSVEKPAANTVRPKTLSWNAPQTREDGSTLKPGSIVGFRIYYRLKHKTRLKVIPVDNPDRTSQPLTDLPPGAYEFSITTVDAQGLESRRSAPVLVDLI